MFFFYVGKACCYYKDEELAIFLEKNAAQIFTKTLTKLYEERGKLNFDSETKIETGNEPNGNIDDKDIKKSIFSYILYSINILCKDLVRFENIIFLTLNIRENPKKVHINL